MPNCRIISSLLSHNSHTQLSTFSSAFLSLLDLEHLDVNLYRGESPLSPRWGRVFGGLALAQSLIAASLSVAQEFTVHSLHGFFLRAGDDSKPIIYEVFKLRDGKNFVARRVIARQDGRHIFEALLSFHRHESSNGLEHQDAMPVSDFEPEILPSMLELMNAWSKDERLTDKIRQGIARSASMPFPFEIRRQPLDVNSNGSFSAHDYLDQRLSKQLHANQSSYLRVSGRLCDNLIVHQCALAYLSDWSMLETVLLPHGIHSYQNLPHKFLTLASLDHTLHFHQPFRADDWLLYFCHSNWAGNARGLVRGEFFDRTGKLIVSTSQEGLVRLTVKASLVVYDRQKSTNSEENAGSANNEMNADNEDNKGEDKPSTHFTLLPPRNTKSKL